MQTLLAALMVGVLGCAAPALAQEKKSEPAGEATKAEVKKAEKAEKAEKQPGEKPKQAEVNKDDAKKKVKRGGC